MSSYLLAGPIAWIDLFFGYVQTVVLPGCLKGRWRID